MIKSSKIIKKYMFNNKSNSKDIIDKLFKDGIIKIENIFEEDFKIFDEFKRCYF